MHSFQLASKINSGQILEGLSEAEKTAYRNVASQHTGIRPGVAVFH